MNSVFLLWPIIFTPTLFAKPIFKIHTLSCITLSLKFKCKNFVHNYSFSFSFPSWVSRFLTSSMESILFLFLLIFYFLDIWNKFVYHASACFRLMSCNTNKLSCMNINPWRTIRTRIFGLVIRLELVNVIHNWFANGTS